MCKDFNTNQKSIHFYASLTHCTCWAALGAGHFRVSFPYCQMYFECFSLRRVRHLPPLPLLSLSPSHCYGLCPICRVSWEMIEIINDD